MIGAISKCRDRIGRWTVSYGDSGPAKLLDEGWVAKFEALAAGAGGNFEYEYFDENLGHGGGHNRLHAGSTEDLLLILNPDGVVASDTLVRLLEAMDDRTGVIDARQLPFEHPKDYDASTGIAVWSSLACALTTSKVFREVGGLDHDTFFMYCDDVDYSWRVRLAGYEARYCPQARMFHDKRMDASGMLQASDAEHFYSAEAALLLAYKYSRDDIVAEVRVRLMREHDNPFASQAVASFDKKVAEGHLPNRLDAANEIAQFTGRTYGAHRF